MIEGLLLRKSYGPEYNDRQKQVIIETTTKKSGELEMQFN